MPFNIAIDGPAGAGKSTVAKQLAKNLGYIYVDTGAMYRAMALYFLRKGIDKDDAGAIEAACEGVEISLEYKDGAQQIILNGENVTSLIRTEEVGNMASSTSVYAPVRRKLVELPEEACAEKRCGDGRQGYWNLRASRRQFKGLPDGRQPCQGHPPLQRTAGKKCGLQSGRDREGHY